MTSTSLSRTVQFEISSERKLAAVAFALDAASVHGMSDAERTLATEARVSRGLVKRVRELILAGEDPLGATFCQLRTPAMRRPQGAVYSPPAIVGSMLSWAASVGQPDRIVDPGSGSGRFIVAAGRRFAETRLVAVENDPLAALLTRANLAVHGLAGRAQVITADYSQLVDHAGFASFTGTTLYLGNPPYVRHHQIAPSSKNGSQGQPRDTN